MVETNVDQIEQDFARFKQPVMAVAGGIAAALVIATLPHVYLENIIGATGLSEIIPAAAPPLGNTARGLIAVVAGMISASALFLFLNHKTKSHEGGSDMSLAIRKNLTAGLIDDERESKSRFSVPKLNLSAKSLTKFLKKPKKKPGQVTELRDLPDIRPADRHPDAPARQPIFASSDLGTPLSEKIKRFDQSVFQQGISEPQAMQSAEQAVQPEVTIAPLVPEQERQRQFEARSADIQTENQSREGESVTDNVDMSDLSLTQLADRLEAGLQRLEALQMRERVEVSKPSSPAAPDAEDTAASPDFSEAPVPLAMPPLRSVDAVDLAEVDQQDRRQADMDAALKAALGTLERMTVRR